MPKVTPDVSAASLSHPSFLLLCDSGSPVPRQQKGPLWVRPPPSQVRSLMTFAERSCNGRVTRVHDGLPYFTDAIEKTRTLNVRVKLGQISKTDARFSKLTVTFFLFFFFFQLSLLSVTQAQLKVCPSQFLLNLLWNLLLCWHIT